MAQASAVNDRAHEPGLSMEDIAFRYTKWAEDASYDKDLSPENYQGPWIAAQFLADQFPDQADREKIKILDVAAGTGLVGVQLKDRGFTKMDALEPSEGMLRLAKAKGVYTRSFQTFLNGTSLEIERDDYDVAVICGGMGEGHIPCSGLDHLLRIVKPGGLVVIVMREAYLTNVQEYKDRLEPHMKELENEKKWKAVSRTVVPRYSFDNNGIVYIFRIL